MKKHIGEGSCSFSTRVCQSAESRDSGTQLTPFPFSFLFHPGTLVHTLVASTFRMCLPSSIHLLQGSPQQHASWVIPNSCVLTVKIAHHSSMSLLSVYSSHVIVSSWSDHLIAMLWTHVICKFSDSPRLMSENSLISFMLQVCINMQCKLHEDYFIFSKRITVPTVQGLIYTYQ